MAAMNQNESSRNEIESLCMVGQTVELQRRLRYVSMRYGNESSSASLVRGDAWTQEAKFSRMNDLIVIQASQSLTAEETGRFRGRTYQVTAVVQTDSSGEKTQLIEVDMYLRNGDLETVSVEEWDLEVFVRERLDDWLDLFAGMELVGDNVEA